MTENKKPLIILTGPTAVGKTSASIGLAKSLGCEIISADSMQVYKYMDIGSAKIMPDEMQGVFSRWQRRQWKKFMLMVIFRLW